MPVSEARKQAEGAQDLVPLAQLPAVQAPSRSVESGSPLIVVDTKGKGIALESPSSKSKKKMKLVKASEGEPREPSLWPLPCPRSRLLRHGG